MDIGQGRFQGEEDWLQTFPEVSYRWRNSNTFAEELFVTYYAEGLPIHWNSSRLFNVIARWEAVIDAFISAKKNVRRLKFGFVRLKHNGRNEAGRLKRLNSIFENA